MPLFSRKNKDFSGSPTAADRSSEFDDGVANPRHNILHKRTQPAGTSTQSGSLRSRSASPSGGRRSAEEEMFVPANATDASNFRRRAGVNVAGAGGAERDFAPTSNQQGILGERMHGTTNAATTNGMPQNANGVGKAGLLQSAEPDTIEGAHMKLNAAMEAEKRAMELVASARAASQDARETIERLHTQAQEQARLAAMKQKEAVGLREGAQRLGRV